MKTGPAYRYKLVGVKKRRKSGYDVFDGTLQKTNVWLNDIMNELDWQEHPYKAYLALRTVLHTLRDRLTIEEAVQLGAQLPMLVRGFYYEGWTLKGNRARSGTRKIFWRLSRKLSKTISAPDQKASHGLCLKHLRATPVRARSRTSKIACQRR